MTVPSLIRRGLPWAAGTLAALIALLAALAAALDTGHFQKPLMRFIASHAGRPLEFKGAFQLSVFSLHPRLIAEDVVIGNPPWVPSGPTAEIAKVILVITLPWFGHGLGVERLEMHGATLHLMRDSTGHANWQWTDPDEGGYQSLPITRSLSMPDARVDLDDAQRHLEFHGKVSAHEVNGIEAARSLRIEGEGLLNGRPASFEIDGDPLTGASHAKPYRFTFAEGSSGSRLTGSGFLSHPFDFDVLDTTFEAAGADLKDLFYLTGIKLVNTGSYRLSGKLVRRGTHTQLNDLVVTSGQSDVRGTVSIDYSGGRPKLGADLNSQLLHLSDLGARAAGRPSEADAGPPLLLSNARLDPAAVRRMDGVVNYHAHRIDVGRVPLQTVAGKMTIDHGVLVLAPLSGDVLGGKFTAQARLDAATDDPAADLDLKIADLRLGQLVRKGAAQPPVDGLLRARVIIKGRGSSIHQVAASANGTVTAVLSHGTIRASLAELTGVDLRGLGLMLSKNAQESAVRCGVASFLAHDGTLVTKSLVVDTDPVLITGEGDIHLDSEALDLALRGHPKGLRLSRLRSPVLVRGTLSHPSAGIQARNSVAQAAEAVALGALLTPLASVLAFVDPGLAKDADCAALLAEAKDLDARAPGAHPGTRETPRSPASPVH